MYRSAFSFSRGVKYCVVLGGVVVSQILRNLTVIRDIELSDSIHRPGY
jgi:hypothetical protein